MGNIANTLQAMTKHASSLKKVLNLRKQISTTKKPHPFKGKAGSKNWHCCLDHYDLQVVYIFLMA
jgi:hypothetical protein